MVDLKEVSPGRFVVTAEYTTRAAAIAAFIRITDGPIERAFKPLPLPPALEAGPPLDPPEHGPPPILEALEAREADTPADMGLNAEAAYRCATGVCAGD